MIRPQWVLINDEAHHVSDFAHLSPSERPYAICPTCQRPVIMKLGRLRTHHFAHQPDDICAINNPETALHFNLKMHIAEELRRNDKFLLENRCSGCFDSKPYLWLQDWDTIEVEYGLENNFRPDIALIKENNTIAAVEIHVTHAVEEAKETFFQEKGIEWVEVKGLESLYTGDDAWRATEPLPKRIIEHCSRKLPRWTCVDCRRREAQRREEKRYHFADHAVKPVDLYWPDGGSVRYFYLVRMRYKDNKPIAAYVFAGKKRKMLASVKAPLKSLKELNKVVRRHIAFFREKQGAIVDEFTGWQQIEDGELRQWKSLELHPHRWRWLGSTMGWVLELVEKDDHLVNGPYRLVHKSTGEVFYLAAISNNEFIVSELTTGKRRRVIPEELVML